MPNGILGPFNQTHFRNVPFFKRGFELVNHNNLNFNGKQSTSFCKNSFIGWIRFLDAVLSFLHKAASVRLRKEAMRPSEKVSRPSPSTAAAAAAAAFQGFAREAAGGNQNWKKNMVSPPLPLLDLH